MSPGHEPAVVDDLIELLGAHRPGRSIAAATTLVDFVEHNAMETRRRP